MIDTVVTVTVSLLLIAAVVVPYWLRVRRKENQARNRFEKLKISGLNAATSMHPHIDALACIGCGGCVEACPEGDVLGVINGKATLVHGAKCIGHGLCAEACPVGAISLVMAPPGRSANLPVISKDFETNIPNLFIAGELGGIGLIKNAIIQGRHAVETVAKRRGPRDGILDLLIVGAGPAGLSAGLTAMEQGLRYAILEQGDIGGTILQYPRRKLVLTSPVELPVWGRLKFTEITKEKLLGVWGEVVRETGLLVQTQEKMLELQRFNDLFRIVSSKDEYVARHVILALGRRGTPRKLGVPGEALPKVMYRLLDAESYQNLNLLIVGGGDSAVEAAIALAIQKTNRVTLSYRQREFGRVKARNLEHLSEQVRKKRIHLALGTVVQEIRSDLVLLSTADGQRQLPNDYVFVSVGGETPFDQLKNLGIDFHRQVIEDQASAA